MSDNYRVSFSLGETHFEIESTDPKWVEKKEKEYLDRLKVSHKLKATKEEPPAPVAFPKNVTIQEFFKTYVKGRGASRPKMAVFLIYYLEKILKKTDVTTDTVRQAFADIAYPRYNKINYADVLAKARGQALLNLEGENWTLTITGEDYVLNSISSAKSA